MLKRRLLKTFALVSVAGLPMVLASVPRSNEIANDTAIYQNLHEIKVNRVKSISFKNDLEGLSAVEKKYREPVQLQISAPMERVMSRPYQPTGAKKSPGYKKHRAH